MWFSLKETAGVPNKPSPLRRPTFRDDLPRYPPLDQLIRVTSATVPGPTGYQSSTVLAAKLYVASTQQLKSSDLIPRDREPCLALDVNNLGLAPGYYTARLSGSYNSLPVYEVGGFSSGSSTAGGGSTTPLPTHIYDLLSVDEVSYDLSDATLTYLFFEPSVPMSTIHGFNDPLNTQDRLIYVINYEPYGGLPSVKTPKNIVLKHQSVTEPFEEDRIICPREQDYVVGPYCAVILIKEAMNANRYAGLPFIGWRVIDCPFDAQELINYVNSITNILSNTINGLNTTVTNITQFLTTSPQTQEFIWGAGDFVSANSFTIVLGTVPAGAVPITVKYKNFEIPLCSSSPPNGMEIQVDNLTVLTDGGDSTSLGSAGNQAGYFGLITAQFQTIPNHASPSAVELTLTFPSGTPADITAGQGQVWVVYSICL